MSNTTNSTAKPNSNEEAMSSLRLSTLPYILMMTFSIVMSSVLLSVLSPMWEAKPITVLGAGVLSLACSAFVGVLGFALLLSDILRNHRLELNKSST